MNNLTIKIPSFKVITFLLLNMDTHMITLIQEISLFIHIFNIVFHVHKLYVEFQFFFVML
jgi:hypothetical protein